MVERQQVSGSYSAQYRADLNRADLNSADLDSAELATGSNAAAESYFAAPGTVVSWWDPLGDDDAFRRYLLAQQEDLLTHCPVEGKRVLDCCTGRGRMVVAAAEHGAASVIGMDVSEEMLTLARSNSRHANVVADFRHGSVTDLGLPDESADVVFCLEALLHLDDPWQAVKEFYRVLAQGGDCVITTVGANPLARLTQPGRKSAHPAGPPLLAAVTAVNEVMTAVFGFMWGRNRATGWLYSKVFRVPVRPLYRGKVERMLGEAGFSVTWWGVKAGPFVREYRWVAHKP